MITTITRTLHYYFTIYSLIFSLFTFTLFTHLILNYVQVIRFDEIVIIVNLLLYTFFLTTTTTIIIYLLLLDILKGS